MKKTKKYLELENKWLWYHHFDVDKRTRYIEIKQYDRRGEVVAMSSGALPPKKYWVKHPKEMKDIKE